MAVPNPLNGINYTSWGGYASLDFATLVAANGGGYITPAHSFGAGHRLGKVGKQWVFVDPDGKVCIWRGVFQAHVRPHVLGGGAQAGRTHAGTVANKYSGAGTTYAQALGDKLRFCHFNGRGAFSYSNPVGLTDGFHPTGLNSYPLHKQFALDGGLTDAIKNIPYCMATTPPGTTASGGGPLFYRPQGASPVQWPDYLDPKWIQYCQYRLSPAQYPLGPGQAFHAMNESDNVSRWINFGHPNERPGGPALAGLGNRNLHLGMGILWSRLNISSSISPRDGSTQTFTDTLNYSKAKLIANLKAKYNNSITALNNAWATGGYYTTFDTDTGFGVATSRGVADEAGTTPRRWFGQFSPSLTGHTAGSDNNIIDSTSWGASWTAIGVGAPDVNNQVKADMDQIMTESFVAWVKGMWDVLVARDPGIIMAPINNYHLGGRPVIFNAMKPYVNLLSGTAHINVRALSDYSQAEGTAHMDWMWNQFPVAHIVNWYSAVDRIDSCLYFHGANGWGSTNTTSAQAQKTLLLGYTFDYKTPDTQECPVVGWQKWEVHDNEGEDTHWGFMSLNDNLYDGRDYRTPGQPDPWAPDRIAATEDNVYTDYLGFGGTTTLQRSDLLVGANIGIFTKIQENFTVTAGATTMIASTATFALTGLPTPTTLATPFRLTAEPGSFIVVAPAATTSKQSLGVSFADDFVRPGLFTIERMLDTPSASTTAIQVTKPPTLVSGDLWLVAVMRRGSNNPFTWPTGWTSLVALGDSVSGQTRLEVRYRIADGTETNITVSLTGSNSQWRARSWKIANPLANPQGAIATGNSTNANPPSLTPTWGSQDTLWISVGAWDGYPGVTVYPTGYTQTFRTLNVGTAGFVEMAGGEKESTAATEDPAAFTSDTEQWVAATVGVRRGSGEGGTTNMGTAWEEILGDLQILATPAHAEAVLEGVDNRARRTQDLLSANHYAQLSVLYFQSPITANSSVTVHARGNATDQSAYGFRYTVTPLGAVTASLVRFSATGTVTTLTSGTSSLAANDVLRIEVTGTTVRGLKNGVTVLSTTDSTIASGLRGGFGVATDSATSEFRIGLYQEGLIGASTQITMLADAGAFALVGNDAETTKVGFSLQADPAAFVWTGVDIATVRAARVLVAAAATYTMLGRDAATTTSTPTPTTSIPLIRVLTFKPGSVAILIIRAAVPTTQVFFYSDPNLVSLHPVMTTDERTALRSGLLTERKVSLAAPRTFEELKVLALDAQEDFQIEITNSGVAGMSGLYGGNTSYSTAGGWA